ncbi:energy transducer TonB [Psychrobacter sp. Ps6]|uniref:energy transducer TonB n=1 Tax=Psychrobacter sp. Ps6 TaxID=2790960 RepID=UPI001EE0BAF1|nr:energy transducer TonB [Psychrobacter sp. Ps6]MCG3879010.1 energy transducer TonB [Psychrobacter sp. Ps6]
MIPNSFTRPITAWITIVVIVLHGVTVWAMMSLYSPPPIEPKNRPKAIQLELITLAEPAKNLPNAESQTKPVSSESLPPKKLPTEPIEKAEPTKPLPKIEVSTDLKTESIEPIITKVEEKQATTVKSTELSKEKSDTDMQPTNLSSVQKLTITESRKVVSASNQTGSTKDKEEGDLSDMIRSVTEQFNHDQAAQKRSAAKQANQKRAEQEKWQADYEAFSHMLVMAANQAEKQENNQDMVEDKVKEDSVFVAEYGSWSNGKEPSTSIPSLIWRNIDPQLGDVFIVMLELHVDIDGHIMEVQVLESSGSPVIDAVATTQVRTGQLNPISNHDKVVDAIVPMSLVYERP